MASLSLYDGCEGVDHALPLWEDVFVATSCDGFVGCISISRALDHLSRPCRSFASFGPYWHDCGVECIHFAFVSTSPTRHLLV